MHSTHERDFFFFLFFCFRFLASFPQAMDRAPNDTPTPSPNYVLGQLARALRAAAINATNPSVAPNAEEKAKARAEEWKRIAQSMADGTLNIGSRAPISGIPEWCTPKIVTGGFATGELLAEGPLLPHEEVRDP